MCEIAKWMGNGISRDRPAAAEAARALVRRGARPRTVRAISPFLSGLSRSLSVLRRLVPLLLARLRLRQTCYVITVGAHSGKFSVSSRVAATLGSRPSQSARLYHDEDCAQPVIYEQWKVHELGCWICLNCITWRRHLIACPANLRRYVNRTALAIYLQF